MGKSRAFDVEMELEDLTPSKLKRLGLVVKESVRYYIPLPDGSLIRFRACFDQMETEIVTASLTGEVSVKYFDDAYLSVRLEMSAVRRFAKRSDGAVSFRICHFDNEIFICLTKKARQISDLRELVKQTKAFLKEIKSPKFLQAKAELKRHIAAVPRLLK